MDKVQAQFNYYNAQLDKELSKYPQALKIEQHTSVPKTYIAFGTAFVIFFLIFFNFWGQLLSNFIAWGYPAYASFKAIESIDKADDTQWLTYWTVFGFISLVEFFSDIILYWLPFYYLFKTIFFLWLALPQFKGADTIYLSPQLKPYFIPQLTLPNREM
ncbi:hypothetical protein G9A89_019516 [Geosiphon pyriformis]|nr:hypothetical protein G9A89_019516 [Geosiphon pyriformis]